MKTLRIVIVMLLTSAFGLEVAEAQIGRRVGKVLFKRTSSAVNEIFFNDDLDSDGYLSVDGHLRGRKQLFLSGTNLTSLEDLSIGEDLGTRNWHLESGTDLIINLYENKNVGIGKVPASQNALDVEGSVHSDFLAVGSDAESLSNAVAHFDGRVYISEEDGLYTDDNDVEHGFANATGGTFDVNHSNYKDYLLWIEEGMVTRDVAIHDISQTADFVFEEDYELPTLLEMENFILTNGHLPNVESAEASKERGLILLGERSTGMLQTIEELTLHTIAQEKKIQAQEALIKALAERLEELEAEFNKE